MPPDKTIQTPPKAPKSHKHKKNIGIIPQVVSQIQSRKKENNSAAECIAFLIHPLLQKRTILPKSINPKAILNTAKGAADEVVLCK